MLEELQRLQAHIGALKTRLDHYEQENQQLHNAKVSAAEQHHAEIAQKTGIITQKQQQIDQLTETATQSNKQLKQMTHDAAALADRYNRLEKSCTDLKNRFQEILSERNDLRAAQEKLQNEQRQSQLEINALQQERGRLLQKNELAQAKVEAIIQRLNILGTSQDNHAEQIGKLAELHDQNEGV
jgi:chromosome segregation ATPase